MPIYDYRCSKCKRSFSLTESIAEHGSRKAKCPACGSTTVERVFSSFFAQTSKKS